MQLRVPASLKAGHESLLATLKRAMREPGGTGEAARAVARILDGHILREEKFALTPLSLIPALARGESHPSMHDAVGLADRLRTELDALRDDHQKLIESLRALARAAQADGKGDYLGLVEDMVLHVRLEEEVLYPASLLVGEYIKRVVTV